MVKVKKVKIYNSWVFGFNIRPLKYQYVVKMEGLNLYGNIEISFVKEEVDVKLLNPRDPEGPRDLITDSIVKDEVVRLAILKEIFYRFCVKSKESIENFKFNYRNEKEPKSIIEALMFYESILYNENKKSERVIFAITDGYRQIKETNKVITAVTLVAMSKLGWKYKTKAYQILKEYLAKNNIKGNLTFIYDGNENEEVGYVNEHHKSKYTIS